MTMTVENLFANLPDNLNEELTDVLAHNRHVRIERILSTGQASPDGFWYDQNEHEWVIVLKGQARLQMQGDKESLLMNPGDHINIPAHQKHRIPWTSPTETTIWLAVFYKDS